MNLFILYSILLASIELGHIVSEDIQNQNTRKVTRLNRGPTVSLPQGRVRGVRKVGENGRMYHVFRNIPYAEPPVGPLRLQFPVPAGGWEGVRDGTTKGSNPCPQYVPHTRPQNAQHVGQVIGDEDCLYLDVWAPKHGSGLGVMVYLHGGYFSLGFKDIDGIPDHLVEENVIVVELQYRIGLLGFLSTGDSEIPGNFGLRDQNLALQWVRNNIENFGGDPNCVTLFGQSAGAASAHLQILSPYSKGLFSRAILQSGNALTHFATRNDHAEVARRVGQDLGCKGVTDDSITKDAKLLECLQAADTDQLVMLSAGYMTLSVVPMLFVPRVDGDFLPSAPELLLRQGLYNKVDIISGITRDEGAMITKEMYAKLHLRIGFLLGFKTTGALIFMLDDEGSNIRDLSLTKWRKKVSENIFKEYVGSVSVLEKDAEQLTKMFTDFHFAVPHDETIQLHAADGLSKVYAYELHHRGQSHTPYDDLNTTIGSHWVPHGGDLRFIFTNVIGYDPLTSKEDLKLRQFMVKLWTNFAKDGNPTPTPVDGITWPAVSKRTNSPVTLDHLILKPNPQISQDTRCKVREFTSSLQTEHNHNLYSGIVTELPKCYALLNV